jgi:hypothetical protein
LTQAKDHTTITLFFEFWDITRGGGIFTSFARAFWEFPGKLNAAYKFLNRDPEDLEISREAALSVLKKWYAENPIEPYPPQEDEFQNTASPEKLDLVGLSMDEPTAERTPITC